MSTENPWTGPSPLPMTMTTSENSSQHVLSEIDTWINTCTVHAFVLTCVTDSNCHGFMVSPHRHGEERPFTKSVKQHFSVTNMAWSSGHSSPTYTHLDEQATNMNNLFLTIVAQETLWLIAGNTRGKALHVLLHHVKHGGHQSMVVQWWRSNGIQKLAHSLKTANKSFFLVNSLEGHL